MGFVDIHTHILPGVDDGSGSMEESLEMLRMAAAEGIRDVILTPHNKAERRNVSMEGMQRRIAALETVLVEENIPIRLYGGNEIAYRDGVVEALEEGKIATLAGSHYVLLEFLPMEEFSYIRNAIYEVTGAGYIPILAHVERYQCMISKMENIAYAIERGALIQVNCSSVIGGMGFKIKGAVKKLLEKQYVHFLGTDTHDLGKRAPKMADCAKYLTKKYDAAYVAALLTSNGQALLKDEQLI